MPLFRQSCCKFDTFQKYTLDVSLMFLLHITIEHLYLNIQEAECLRKSHIKSE